MDCISPPALRDEQLWAYFEGDAAADIVAHVERCAYCRQRAQSLARQNQRVAAQLYRAACPSPVELGEYELGLLSATQVHLIQLHVADCPHCTRELQQLQGYLADLAPTVEIDPLAALAERVRVLIARLGDNIASLGSLGGPAPALAGIRGEQAGQSIYTAEDVQVIIEVQQDPSAVEQQEILGLVLGLDNSQSMAAHLWQADQRVAVTQVNELGNFVFSGLAPGHYALILSGAGLEIHIQALRV